jgi:imidazolonepropionase
MTTVFRHASQIVGAHPPGVTRLTGEALRNPAVIPDGAIVLEGDRIAWVGPTANLPPIPAGAEVEDLTGQVVLPGFIDSHTHLVFAGDRLDEFEQRLDGLSYQEISARGGGIMSTVRRVRSATPEELREATLRHLGWLMNFGVTTVEIKSGYGLTTADEVKLLEVVAGLSTAGWQRIVPTFLGAHAVPAEFAGCADDYVRLVCDEMLPEVARRGLARFCDVFCETGVFSLAQTERILTRARDLGLGLKLHADELSPLGGAELAARLGAISADHLLCITPAGIEALARSGTVATLLPGTAFFLGLDFAPARRLIKAGATVALASDCNPGTCPSSNLPLLGAMACTRMGMLPAEVVNALALNAAAALGLGDRLGSLTPGKQADLSVWRVHDYRQLFYEFGVWRISEVYIRGQLVCAT